MKNFFVVFLFLFLSFFDAYVYAKRLGDEITSSVIRLHVIANDNSEKAQEIKLKVRDALLLKIRKEELSSYDAAYQYIEEHREQLLKCVYDVLNETGAQYEVTIGLEECDFPTKEYDYLKFPKGKYTAVRVRLGEAKGNNWWCVMYPALCFSNEVCEDEEATKQLESSLSSEAFEVLIGKARFKFKILEFFAN